MIQQYEVHTGTETVGKVQVLRQGLYYRFICRCSITGNVPYRLIASCNGNREDLGILIPENDGFGLNTSIPFKRLGEGTLSFSLLPKHDKATGRFVPISPEEPFSYISRIKQSFLTIKNGKTGIIIKEMQEQ